MRPNPIKKKLLAGKPVFGAFGWEFLVPGLPQIVKSAGAEFLLLDMEHAGTNYDQIKTQAALCRGIDVVPMARVPANQYQYISRALDVGCMGIMAPMVGLGGGGRVHRLVHALSAARAARRRVRLRARRLRRRRHGREDPRSPTSARW